jgi:hypothetical protein
MTLLGSKLPEAVTDDTRETAIAELQQLPDRTGSAVLGRLQGLQYERRHEVIDIGIHGTSAERATGKTPKANGNRSSISGIQPLEEGPQR